MKEWFLFVFGLLAFYYLFRYINWLNGFEDAVGFFIAFIIMVILMKDFTK